MDFVLIDVAALLLDVKEDNLKDNGAMVDLATSTESCAWEMTY